MESRNTPVEDIAKAPGDIIDDASDGLDLDDIF